MRAAARAVTSVVAACVAASAMVATAAPAHADTSVVPGGTRLGERAFLTYVPCSGFFDGGAAAPQLRINRGPAQPPLGRRSFGLVMSGPGTAAGAVHQTLSMAGLGRVAMSVSPERATTGVAYVWYVSPDLPAGQAWLGRADLTAVPGWQQVDVGAARVTGQAPDRATRGPQGAPATASLADFVAAHGDGPGYVVSGFGCDGSSFNLDALAFGPSTYDLEGFAANTQIAVEPAAPGRPVTLRGWSTRGSAGRLGDPLVLERQVPGTDRWEAVTGPLFADPDAVVRTTVSPDVPTYVRWLMADSEYADENRSEPVLVDAVSAPSDRPSDQPSDQPSDRPSDQSSDPASAGSDVAQSTR